MGKKANIITLLCNKGGVGRSTTAINIGWSLADSGRNVLVCDLDSQANASYNLAKDYTIVESSKNISQMMSNGSGSFSDYISETRHSRLKLLGSTLFTDKTEADLRRNQTMESHRIFDRKLDKVTGESFDYIIFDTPPSKSSILMLNALLVSDWFWYIIGAEDQWALDARVIMDKIVADVQKLNTKLSALPVLLTRYKRNNTQSKFMKQICQETFEKGVFADSVRDTTFITKSNSARQSIFEYDRRHNCAKDYTAIAQELIKTVESRKNSEIVSRRMNSQTNETISRNISAKE
mgnify:FL=1